MRKDVFVRDVTLDFAVHGVSIKELLYDFLRIATKLDNRPDEVNVDTFEFELRYFDMLIKVTGSEAYCSVKITYKVPVTQVASELITEVIKYLRENGADLRKTIVRQVIYPYRKGDVHEC